MAQIGLLRLGKTLRERRGDLGIREVAAKIGVSPATLSRVERGKLPDLATFKKICDWLELDPAEILQTKKPTPGGQADAKSGYEAVVATHFRADSALSPEAAQDLARLILTAHHAIVESSEKP